MLTINKIKMKGRKKNIGSPICSIDYAFRRIGSKYKARILLYLYRNEVLRYGELRRNVIDITPKMLTQSLRELEQDELVHRAVFPESPPRVEYTLTDTGLRFIPFINELRTWGDQQMAKLNIPAIAALECEENSDSSIDEIGKLPVSRSL
jgi:DNA-binding HxlR family transcriptional regulator